MLLTGARGLTEQHAITGARVYGDDQFMQVIEGEEEAVTTLYRHITQDCRHQNVFKLADKAIPQGLFTQCPIAFDEVSADQFKDLLGYVSPQQLATTSGADQLLLLDRMREIVCN